MNGMFYSAVNAISALQTFGSVLAEGDPSDGPEFPTIADFLPEPFVFQGTPFAMNRLTLIRLVMMTFVLLFFGIILSRAKKRSNAGNHIPSKMQSLVELLFGFIKQTVYENVPAQFAKKWYPMALTMFTTILVLNLSGIVPGLNLAGTAGIGIPLVFAVWVYTAYWRTGIKANGGGVVGFGRFIKHELFPPGIPLFVYPIYALLEFLQILIIRPASLAIRLFANMMSGHILVAMTIVSTQFFVIVAGPQLKAFGLLTFVGTILFMCFEMLVAVLQAYVFMLLMCVYVSLSAGHQEENIPLEDEAYREIGKENRDGTAIAIPHSLAEVA